MLLFYYRKYVTEVTIICIVFLRTSAKPATQPSLLGFSSLRFIFFDFINFDVGSLAYQNQIESIQLFLQSCASFNCAFRWFFAQFTFFIFLHKRKCCNFIFQNFRLTVKAIQTKNDPYNSVKFCGQTEDHWLNRLLSDQKYIYLSRIFLILHFLMAKVSIPVVYSRIQV